VIKIILHGCNGAMGRVISEMAADDADLSIAAGTDISTEQHFTYPVYRTLEEIPAESADVLVDFSVAAAVDEVISYAEKHHMPAVVCTTGLSEEQLKRLSEAAKSTAVLRSANMSLGVNLLQKLAADAARTLAAAGFDIEIVEKHHHRKLDAPSGTALALADSVNEACGNTYHYVYDRSTRHAARDPKEIGISSVRAGSIVGDHDIIFAGEDEVITLSHTAYSRKIFAKGALSAARFLAGKPAGFYGMADVISGG
jgi:4-hydroxy-tetrahydrodipicolinate reductase